MLTPGDRLRDYEVIAPLPSGGMAMLYLARRRGVGGFSQQVALKLVHPQLVADKSMLELFLDEARLSARVVHPNVVRVHEVGVDRGNYFIAMEYVDGASLSELLAGLNEKRLRLRRKLCVWLATQVAEALHATHEARGENGAPLDIVHRDVSPQNVLIGHAGHVKLIDFGIASSRGSAAPLETGPFVLGKLRYAAPERLRLEPIDRRADVYSLGVMLWEMLTSRSFLRCHHVDDPHDWAIRDNPQPPSKYAPRTPSLLDAVVLKAIHPDPRLRYPNALRFQRALLRADPSAARVDAHRIAALMQLALGDALDRRPAAVALQHNSFIEELQSGLPEPPGSSPGVELSDSTRPRLRRVSSGPRATPSAPRLAMFPPALAQPHTVPAPRAQSAVPGAWSEPGARPPRRALQTGLWGALLGALIGALVLGLQSNARPPGAQPPPPRNGAGEVRAARMRVEPRPLVERAASRARAAPAKRAAQRSAAAPDRPRAAVRKAGVQRPRASQSSGAKRPRRAR